MAEKIQGYRFGIDLDDGGMTRSLKEIRNEAKLLKSEMKANFTEIKSTGDAMGAYSKKVTDAKRAIEGQEAVVKKLKSAQEGLDLTTEKGRSAYQKYQNQINRAKTEISNLTDQQDKAKKSADLLQSGVVDLAKSTKLASDADEALAKRLDAQGRASEATAVRNNNLAKTNASLSKQLEIQKQRLADVATESGKDSEEFKRQSIRVNELGTKVAETSKKLQEMRPTGFDKLTNSIHQANGKAEHTNSLFGKIFGAQMLSNGIISAWGSVTSSIKEAISAGKEFDIEQQKMGATWQTLTGSMDKAKDMVKTINKYSVATGQDIDLVDELEQGYYHLHSNKKESDMMTSASLNLEDAVGLNKQQSLAVRQDMVNGLARGNVSQGLLNQTSQYFPMFREALAKFLTSEIKSGKAQFGMKEKGKDGKQHVRLMKSVEVSDLPKMTKAGIIGSKEFEQTFDFLGNHKYKEAADNMMKTMFGMERTIKARVPALLGDVEKPLLNAKNPLYQAVSKWVSDPKTDKEFTKVGKSLSGGVNTVTKAFGKAFGSKSATKTMDDALASLAKGVTSTSKTIAKNAPEITSFFKTLKSLGNVGFKTFVETLKIANFLLKPFIKLIGDHSDTVAKFAASWFLVNKAMKLFEKGLNAIGAIKNIFGKAAELIGLKKETAAIDAQNAELKENIKLKEESNAAGSGGGGKVAAAEEVANDLGGAGIGKESKVIKEAETGSRVARRAEEAAKGSKGLRRFLPKFGGTAIKDASKFGKFGKIAAGSVGGLDVLMAGADLIGTTKKTVGSHVGAAGGSLGGTALGAAIGTAIFPGIGTAVGAGLGGLTGEFAGKKFGQAIQRGLSHTKLKAPKVKQEKTSKARKDLDKTAINYYAENEKAEKKNLKTLLKNGAITKREYNARLKELKRGETELTSHTKKAEANRNAIAEYYAQSKKKLTQKWNSKILADTKKYGKNSTQVEKDEDSKKKALSNQQLKFATKVTAKEAKLHTTLAGKVKLSARTQDKTYKDLAANASKYSKKKLLSLVANSNKEYKAVKNAANNEYDEVVGKAQKKYKETVKAAQGEYKGNSDYAKKKRKSIIDNAKEQRDRAVEHAENQRKDSIEKAKKTHDKTVWYAHKQNTGITAQTAELYSKTKSNNSKTKDNFTGTWSDIFHGVGKWVGKLISGLNKGPIKGQNQVFKQYGGSKTMQPITASYYATGTGMFSNVRRPITKPTLAILNDGNDSPETGNQEMVVHENGMGELIQGTNVPRILKPHDEVVNASELKALHQMGALHFADGTGMFSGISSFFKGIFGSLQDKLDFVTKAAGNSKKSFKGVWNPDTKDAKPKGVVAENYASLIDNEDKDQAQNWWGAAWNVIKGVANPDDLGGDGPAGALLQAVEKYGHGHKYVWGATGPDSFDCSGLVMYALQHAFGISVPHFSGAQYNDRKVFQPISASEAKSGDAVFWGPGDHVGIYAGGGQYYSAYNPSAHPNIGMYPVKNSVPGKSPMFARVKGISTGSKGSKKDTKEQKSKYKGLEANAEGRLKDSGVLGWVKKFLAPLSDALGFAGGGGGNAITKDMIAKAEEVMHVPSSIRGQIANAIMKTALSETHNRSIMQSKSTHDVNSGGNEARGPLQYTPGTFRTFAMPGHTNIMNPYDQVLAFLNNSDYRNATGNTVIWGTPKYDWLHSGPQGHRRFENGGLSKQHGMVEISEHNMPEMVIPLSQMKSSRGYELLGKTAAIMAKRDGNGVVETHSSDKFADKMMSKLDNVIDLLATVVANQGNPVPAIVSAQNVISTINNHQKTKKINQNLGRGVPLGN